LRDPTGWQNITSLSVSKKNWAVRGAMPARQYSRGLRGDFCPIAEIIESVESLADRA
jgi:hypothetical protein